MSDLQKHIERLTRRFETIGEERMRGLPFYNTRLQVEALAFEEMPQGYIGALITPWFINIVWLFKQATEPGTVGRRYTHTLPSGDHDFMIGMDEELGRYDFISLASPTGKFKTQQQARDFASRKLSSILEGEDNPATEERPVSFITQTGEEKMSRRRFFGEFGNKNNDPDKTLA